jgi:hypothetical protein
VSALTDTRRAIKDALSGLSLDVHVATGPGAYPGEQHFIIRVLVGDPTEENEARLDDLLEDEGESSVKTLLHAARFGVSKHSGHRLYEVAPQKRVLGAEWTVIT